MYLIIAAEDEEQNIFLKVFSYSTNVVINWHS